MPKIKLDLSKDLYVNDSNQLDIRISEKEGNTLEIRDNGLYSDGSKGEDGSDSGDGYDKQSYGGVRIGYNMYGSTETNDHRVTLTNIVHRVFNSNNPSGTDLTDFRKEIDYVLPGDMFKYEDKIYLITKVTTTGYDGTEFGPGNVVVSYVPLMP